MLEQEQKELVDVGAELQKRNKTNVDTFYVDAGNDIDSDIVIGLSEGSDSETKKGDFFYMPSPPASSLVSPSSADKPKLVASPDIPPPLPLLLTPGGLSSPKEVLIGGITKKSPNTASSHIPLPVLSTNKNTDSCLSSKLSGNLTGSPVETISKSGTENGDGRITSPSKNKADGSEKGLKLEKPSLPLPQTPTRSTGKAGNSEKSKEVSPQGSDPNYDKLKSPDDLHLVQCHEIQSKISPLFSTQFGSHQPEKRPVTPEYSVPNKLHSIPSTPQMKKHVFTSASSSMNASVTASKVEESEERPTALQLFNDKQAQEVPKPNTAHSRSKSLANKVKSPSSTEKLLSGNQFDGSCKATTKLAELTASSKPLQAVQSDEKSRLSSCLGSGSDKVKDDVANVDEPLLPPSEDRKPPSVVRKTRGTTSDIAFDGSAISDGRTEDTSSDAWLMTVSAIYGKLLLIMGIALPLTELTMSEDNSVPFFEGFFLYLYYISILFLAFVYISSFRKNDFAANVLKSMRLRKLKQKKDLLEDVNAAETASTSTYSSAAGEALLVSSSGGPLNYGSLYLRIAAVAFGIGSMVYTGLECSQFFEIIPESQCDSVLKLVGPLTRLVFIFLQTYFIFMNSKLVSSRHKAIFCFGLVHMIATNVCIWISVVLTEAKIEIDTYDKASASAANYSEPYALAYRRDLRDFDDAELPAEFLLSDRRPDVTQTMTLFCHRTGMMGKFLNRYSPFLAPCVIAYSLISAGILFAIWRRTLQTSTERVSLLQVQSSEQKLPLDGSRSNLGLFLGIIIFVSAILSLILYFIMVEEPSLRAQTVLALSSFEFILYTLTFLSAILGICQMRELKFRPVKTRLQLDNALLIISQTGVLMYCMFTVTASYFSASTNFITLLSATMNLSQACLQTLFILNAMRRVVVNTDQVKRKPGRQVVTFLFVANFAMWALNVFEKSRADAHPFQLEFFGAWAWAVVTHVSLPLAIFYRFHSTVCLFEVWKNCFKPKPEHL